MGRRQQGNIFAGFFLEVSFPPGTREYRLSNGKPEYSCCNFAAFL
jgi:hypothetical protein